MISNTVLSRESWYHPLGKSPPICLTQDIPQELNADILLLGCGDARHILFTCFTDSARKIDVTCCDIEPGIHARNVLLYTLLIDDEGNHNIKCIGDIYYHWKIFEDSMELLETQVQKLLDISKSIDEWHDSVYGSSIRFCDQQSLSSVRCYWEGFSTQGLTIFEKAHRRCKMQAMIDNAKAYRKKLPENNVTIIKPDCLCLSPVINSEALEDLKDASKYWWNYGTAIPSGLEPQHLNPTFLYSPNRGLRLDYALFPFYGFPLSTAFAPICKESMFFVGNKSASPLEKMAISAMNHFREWASAFRTALANKSVIRIFSGDALAFCFTLRNCRLTQSTSLNLFCHNWTSSRLILDKKDYGENNSSAPLTFDVIDTSNLVDTLGSLNIMPLVSGLLKHYVSSSLYTQNLIQQHFNVALANFFHVDLCLMSFLLGLVEPNLVVNATNSVEEDLFASDDLKILLEDDDVSGIDVRVRLRWKRLGKCGASHASPFVHVEAKELAKFLIKIYDVMFKYEDLSFLHSPSPDSRKNVMKMECPPYNRASFASLLSVIKANVVSNWDECMENFYNEIFNNTKFSSHRLNSALDLTLNMHVFGVDNGWFCRPTSADMTNAILASTLPLRKDLPDQLCVTVRVSREHIRVNKFKGIVCSFEGEDSTDKKWTNIFSSVKIMFGKWQKQTMVDVSSSIEEDSDQLFGKSDMFVSVMVPTLMLLQSKQSVPLVKCKLTPTVQNVINFKEILGPDLCFASCKLTSMDVLITRFMPGMPALPTFLVVNEKCAVNTVSTTMRLTKDASKIDVLVARRNLESEAIKLELRKSDELKTTIYSPLIASVKIPNVDEIKLEFPVPVSQSKSTTVVRSWHIEIVARLLEGNNLEAGCFLFPIFPEKVPRGMIVPALWASTRLNVDMMPPLNIKDEEGFTPWFAIHMTRMWSMDELRLKDSDGEELEARMVVRTYLKETLFTIFTDYVENQCEYFGLKKMDDGSHFALILPSSLRLDLVNNTLFLDCAFVFITPEFRKDRRAMRLLKTLINEKAFRQQQKLDFEVACWRCITPALVERCRNWNHTVDCKYIRTDFHFNTESDESTICSCGIGKFPNGYLENKKKRFSDLDYVLNCYAARAVIAPVFSLPYVEDCATREYWTDQQEAINKKPVAKGPTIDFRKLLGFGFQGLSIHDLRTCKKCGAAKRKNGPTNQDLLTCSKCKVVKYCSTNCQKADWKKHKQFCKSINQEWVVG